MVGSACTSGPDRSIAIMASALLMVMSSRASSSATQSRAASYNCSASSISPERTFDSAFRRSSSARFKVGSDIPTLTLSTLRLPRSVEFLGAFEFDEALDLFLGAGAERSQFVEHRLHPAAFLEEIADAEIERLQNLEQRVQADLVLPLLHARQIGLMNPDALGELHLCQLALTAKLADLASDKLELCWLIHRGVR